MVRGGTFAARLAAIPEDVLRLARGTCWPDATLAEVLGHAEMMMQRLAGESGSQALRGSQVLRGKLGEDRQLWQPWLTARQTRIIRDALAGHEVVVDEDVAALKGLREWFGGVL